VLSTAVTPVPEEAALLAAGWFARESHVSLPVVVVCAWSAILAGDVATFALGRGLLQRFIGSERLRRIFPAQRRAWANLQVARRGWRGILMARFLVGLRGFLYFALGGSRYPIRRFFSIDAAVGLIEVSLVVAIGYFVGATRGSRRDVEIIDALAIAILGASFALPHLVRKFYGRPTGRNYGP
jgi:membrane-associated protein